MFSEIHGEINYAGKGVDKYDPLLPVSMPRGYGGVAIIWRKDRPYNQTIRRGLRKDTMCRDIWQ